MDRFRGRLVVPIFDSSGVNILGFGGRIIESIPRTTASGEYKVPKYLNSPESRVFKKKDVLFGYHIAKEAMSAASDRSGHNGTATPLVVVEGYMDAMVMWQAGIRASVACMGTGLTSEQLLSAMGIARDCGGTYRFWYRAPSLLGLF